MSVSPGGQPTLGRYTLVREIARSNDIVWEGRDPQMNRRLAVKELALPPNLSGQARRDRIERFFREARAAGAMSHPNIVTIYEVGEDHGRYFIAMEYLEGQTLRERISVGGPISLSEAGGYASALCGALQYAHERGIIHRDIKPDNIHLLPGGILKLTDFGIARITTEDQLTIAGQVFGTPSYMSPEQILGHPIDARSDQFALAIVIYEMISGLKPFQGDSVPTITYRIIHEQAPHVLGAPPAIDAVLQRAMAKNPADRYESVAQFAAALASALALGTSGFRATGSYPAAAPAMDPHFAPQRTAQYGAQTQYGVAPGMGAASPPPALRTNPPTQYAAPPPASDYAAPGRHPGDNTQKTILAIVVSVILVVGVLVGGGLLLTKAFHNYNGQASNLQVSELFGEATQLYQFGDYESAAMAFNKVRLSPSITSDMRDKSIQYEVYCYRQLAHKAQDSGDLETAAKWYQSALTIAPGDAQTQSEISAVQKLRMTAPGGTAAVPSLPNQTGTAVPANGTTPAVPTPPVANVTTNDFEAARGQSESRSQPYLTAGKAADSKGDWSTAQQQYRKAMEMGPGSPSAIEASGLLDQSLKAHPDNSLIGN